MKLSFKLTEFEEGFGFTFRDLDDKSGKFKVFYFDSPKDLLDFFEKNKDQLTQS